MKETRTSDKERSKSSVKNFKRSCLVDTEILSNNINSPSLMILLQNWTPLMVWPYFKIPRVFFLQNIVNSFVMPTGMLTSGSVPFWTYLCCNYWDQWYSQSNIFLSLDLFYWLDLKGDRITQYRYLNITQCSIFTDFEFLTSLGTSVLLLFNSEVKFLMRFPYYLVDVQLMWCHA